MSCDRKFSFVMEYKQCASESFLSLKIRMCIRKLFFLPCFLLSWTIQNVHLKVVIFFIMFSFVMDNSECAPESCYFLIMFSFVMDNSEYASESCYFFDNVFLSLGNNFLCQIASRRQNDKNWADNKSRPGRSQKYFLFCSKPGTT